MVETARRLRQGFDLSGWRGEQSASDVSEVAARKTGDLLRRTLVLATHDPELANRCDRTVRMRDGRIEGE
jgi:predicted ABC-type transport system involved in lysophospholipase L1 biosynthesis ATPase subunit